MRSRFEAPREAIPRATIRRLTVVGIALIALLNGADVFTTRLVIARSGVEANPLAGVLLSNGVLLWVKLVIVALAALVAVRIGPRLGVLLMAWFVAGVYATAVLSNVLILRLT